jgi:thioesterase domain-containing protein
LTSAASQQLRTTQPGDATPPDVAAALTQLAAHCRKMPPVAALGARPLGYDGAVMRFGAPLKANVNDKGCAFGGSLGGLMTLAAWGWVTLRLRLEGVESAEVYVADSRVKYLAPLYEDLVAEAMPAEGEDWLQFVETLQRYGKARITMQARVPMAAGGEATVFSGRFVAMRPMR